MGSVGHQNPWAPYDTYKDCSQGICSIYCPQWCYIIFPPPPPFLGGGDGGDSDTDFSPLIIAVIGIFASAFILVSYYTIISKYCRRGNSDEHAIAYNGDPNSESWQVTPAGGGGRGGARDGLDESIIKSISVCKYKKGDGFVIEGTDCSVCLSEFQENETLRLLPKCNHAFHLPCIDTWLKSHASCPLCRAHIASTNILPPQPPPPPPLPMIHQEPRDESYNNTTTGTTITTASHEYQYRTSDGVQVVIRDLERGVEVEEEAVVSVGDHIPKKRIEGFGLSENVNIIEIINNNVAATDQPIRRSVSLNSSSSYTSSSSSSSLWHNQISIADILLINEEEDAYDNYQMRDLEKNKNNIGILNLVRSPLAMRRSISTGRRFIFTKFDEKGKSSINPN